MSHTHLIYRASRDKAYIKLPSAPALQKKLDEYNIYIPVIDFSSIPIFIFEKCEQWFQTYMIRAAMIYEIIIRIMAVHCLVIESLLFLDTFNRNKFDLNIFKNVFMALFTLHGFVHC